MIYTEDPETVLMSVTAPAAEIEEEPEEVEGEEIEGAEDTEGVSPEELSAAAHATCVSMALAHALAEHGHAPARLVTDATATFDKTEAGFRLTTMKLAIDGEVEGIDGVEFLEAAEGAAENCPVSQALKGNVEISVEATLSSPSPSRSA